MGRGREAETLRGEEGRKRRAGTRALSGDGGGDARASREGGGARNTLGPVPPASPSPPGSGRSRRNPSQGCDPAPPRSARRCLREPRRLARRTGLSMLRAPSRFHLAGLRAWREGPRPPCRSVRRPSPPRALRAEPDNSAPPAHTHPQNTPRGRGGLRARLTGDGI